jgi:nucleoside-diphosphate-sugar epimerase
MSSKWNFDELVEGAFKVLLQVARTVSCIGSGMDNFPPLLITGATGFVGRRLLEVAGIRAQALSTRSDAAVWPAALKKRQCVIHLAARVHQMHDLAGNSLVEYRKINVEDTLELAKQAAACDVKRFIFVSSVKVNGERTTPGHPFRVDEVPVPQDLYGVSKMEAEQGLRAIAQHTGMEVVIVRPPLVYGPGVKANFAALMRAVKMELPLPLGAIHNQRSLVGIDNLVDFLMTCIDHPLAANETFLVSDGQDFSVPDLVRGLAEAMGVKAHLLSIPVSVLQFSAALIGKRDAVSRLCENLQVDIDKARKLLAWIPPVSIYEGLRRTVREAATL